MSKVFKSQGIILRTVKYSESSIISDIYTREKGLKSFIASGVRTSKAGSKAAIYHPCTIVELVGYEQDAEKLSRIKEISLGYHYKNINIQILISSIAIFILEVTRNSIKEKEPNTELYDFLYNWFLYLDDDNNYNISLHLKFMIEFSYFLGFGPLDSQSNESPHFDMLEGIFGNYYQKTDNILDAEDSAAISELIKVDRNNLNTLQWPKTVRNRLNDHLIRFYKLHISSFRDLNSLEILRMVL